MAKFFYNTHEFRYFDDPRIWEIEYEWLYPKKLRVELRNVKIQLIHYLETGKKGIYPLKFIQRFIRLLFEEFNFMDAYYKSTSTKVGLSKEYVLEFKKHFCIGLLRIYEIKNGKYPVSGESNKIRGFLANSKRAFSSDPNIKTPKWKDLCKSAFGERWSEEWEEIRDKKRNAAVKKSWTVERRRRHVKLMKEVNKVVWTEENKRKLSRQKKAFMKENYWTEERRKKQSNSWTEKRKQQQAERIANLQSEIWTDKMRGMASIRAKNQYRKNGKFAKRGDVNSEV